MTNFRFAAIFGEPGNKFQEKFENLVLLCKKYIDKSLAI